MIRVLSLPYGWSLMRDANTGRPWFERRGHTITPNDMAGLPEARFLFREVKRELDRRDLLGGRIDDPDFRAVDMGKFALEMALTMRGRFSPDLLETGVN